MSQEQERGFKVTDKRAAFQEEPSTSTEESFAPSMEKDSSPSVDSPPKEDTQSAHQHETQTDQTSSHPPLPEANLLTILFSLYTQAQICLGVVPDPMAQQVVKDLPQAKYNIDLLGVLKDKTQGNLTQEEAQTLEQMLYEVRMAYIAASQ